MKRIAFTTIMLTVLTTYAIQTAGQTSNPQGVVDADSTFCGFFNSIEILDPPGDATPGAPAYVDILGLTVRQIGQYVQIEWTAGDNPYNEENFFFMVAFDTDRNPETGQWWGGAGAEFRIGVENFESRSAALAVLFYFDPMGELERIERDYPVMLSDTGFIINIDKSKIPTDHFNLYFEASGFPPWRDEGTLTEIQLQAARDPVHVQIDSPNTVLESKPMLINNPQKSEGVQLTASFVSSGYSTPLDPAQVIYSISHQAAHVVPDPESIISIDAGGVAHYNSEGYVTATATDVTCHLAIDKFILATGDVYGVPLADDVIAVFPTDYVPPESAYSFGDMMSGYPNYLYTLNLAYDITSDLYGGFIPLNGDKQILAPLVLEGHCGAAGNPLAIAPCCYMNCGSGEPQYRVAIHEMGHNFHQAPGMSQFLWANESRFANEGVYECVASFPVIYFNNEISLHGEQYGLGSGTYEWSIADQFVQSDRADWAILEDFEVYLNTGQSSGFFDNPGLFDSVSMFCAFFQAYIYDYDGHSTSYGHNMIRRFMNIFGNEKLPDFQEEKVETYFAAAFSISAGSDEREQLRHWGFAIDNGFYEQIEPIIASILAGSEDIIFSDSFEGEGTPDNYPPVNISIPITEGQVGAPYLYDVQATDAHSDSPVYELSSAPPGMTVSAETSEISGTPANPGLFPAAATPSESSFQPLLKVFSVPGEACKAGTLSIPHNTLQNYMLRVPAPNSLPISNASKTIAGAYAHHPQPQNNPARALPAKGLSLLVENASFEEHALATGEATLNGVGLNHWTIEPGEAIGVKNISNLVNFPGGAPDGVNVAYSQGPGISQVLSEVLVEGSTYALSAKVGNHPCCAFAGYSVQLLAGGAVIAEDAGYISVQPGTFETALVTYSSALGDPHAGEVLEIRLLSLGPEVAFDAVTLTVSTEPYPDWELLDSNPAVFRVGANMVFDSARNVAVTFGGWTDSTNADTWEFNVSCNHWSRVVTDHSPPARVWYSMVYDSNRQRIVIFGGMNPESNTFFSDTWEYDGVDWQQVFTTTSPPAMIVRTMVFDSGRNRTVLFGGEAFGILEDDTWEYDGADWTQVITPDSPPPPGALSAMAYDAARNRSILTFDDGTTHLATWEYDGLTWSEVNTVESPFGRSQHTMAYDNLNHNVMLFGGISPYYDAGSSMNDTWVYDGQDWTRVITPHTLLNVDQHAMAFDTTNGQGIVLNGVETWAYRLAAQEPTCEFSKLVAHPQTVYLRDGVTTEQLRIEIRDRDLRPRNPDDFEFEFSSSDPALVQVSAEGLITSTGYGHAQVEVTIVEAGMSTSVEVFAGHLRTQPILQYLSLDGHATGEVWVDMGNADGTPVDLAGHTVEYLCSGCDPGEPLQVDANGVVQAVDVYAEGDPTPLAVMAIVDGMWAQNWALVHVSEFDYGLTVADYVTQNTILASPINAGDYDFDHVINTVRLPEMLEYGFHAEKELAGGVWGGGGKQTFAHYVSPPVVTGIPACGGSGNPIQLGSDLYDPLMTCFITESAPEEMTHGYGIPFHELGHNFTWTHSRFADFADGGDGFAYSEGLATAMGMFACESILRDSEALGLSPELINILEYSWLCWRSPRSGEWLADYVASGANYANFDPNIVDEIIWNLVQEHGWGILYRFYSSLLPREYGPFPFPIETAEQQATFFALAMSEAADTDLKPRFRDDWGFPIDDAAWELMQPLVGQLVAQRDPASYAGADRIISIDDVVTLSDAFVFDPEGDDVAIEWQIISQPEGANAQLGDNSTLHTTFTADQLGSYTLGLSASDQWVRGEQDMMVISVEDSNLIFSNGFE